MERILRVGVIGANPNGSWGSVAHLPALARLPQFRTTAVSTAHIETACETAKHFDIPNAFADPRSLATHPDVDVVAIAVRVPAHKELVTIALDAGKHVYCEWPLGKTTAEAIALRDAADAAGVMHMTGLQARRAPAISYIRDLIAEGSIGTVREANLIHSIPWTFTGRGPSSSYLLDRESGAHFLSIPGGHSIDTLCYLLGEFTSLSATMQTLGDEAQAFGISKPSYNQVVIGGVLGNGVVAGIRLQGSSAFGIGVRLEIGGDRGDLIVTTVAGGRGIQMSDLKLQRTTATGVLEDLAIPDSYFADLPASIRKNPPLNVAKAYLALHEAITSGTAPSPNFSDAIIRHKTLDAIQQSQDEDRTITL